MYIEIRISLRLISTHMASPIRSSLPVCRSCRLFLASYRFAWHYPCGGQGPGGRQRPRAGEYHHVHVWQVPGTQGNHHPQRRERSDGYLHQPKRFIQNSTNSSWTRARNSLESCRRIWLPTTLSSLSGKIPSAPVITTLWILCRVFARVYLMTKAIGQLISSTYPTRWLKR